jgi:hypothetical protein
MDGLEILLIIVVCIALLVYNFISSAICIEYEEQCWNKESYISFLYIDGGFMPTPSTRNKYVSCNESHEYSKFVCIKRGWK